MWHRITCSYTYRACGLRGWFGSHSYAYDATVTFPRTVFWYATSVLTGITPASARSAAFFAAALVGCEPADRWRPSASR